MTDPRGPSYFSTSAADLRKGAIAFKVCILDFWMELRTGNSFLDIWKYLRECKENKKEGEVNSLSLLEVLKPLL